MTKEQHEQSLEVLKAYVNGETPKYEFYNEGWHKGAHDLAEDIESVIAKFYHGRPMRLIKPKRIVKVTLYKHGDMPKKPWIFACTDCEIDKRQPKYPIKTIEVEID